MGAEGQTKKLGAKNNDMKAKQPRWRERCGGEGGVCFLYGLISLFACVCLCLCLLNASLGQVRGPVDTDYIHLLAQ